MIILLNHIFSHYSGGMSLAESKDQWIFAHRGLWNSIEEQNSKPAIENAFSLGFGVETDIRSFLGSLVISHDPIMSSENLVGWEISNGNRFALNLKEDGLVKSLNFHKDWIASSSSFLFDGSLPQMYLAWKSEVPHALRVSEYEKEVPWSSEFLWIDGFETDWWIDDKFVMSLTSTTHCVFVSPELHGRDHHRAFDWFAKMKSNMVFDFSVCTDFPEELRDHLGS